MPNSALEKLEKNLDWNLLKVFLGIVRYQGVSRAAEAMARQQPAISGSLKRLEDCVGARLCKRGPAGFELTDEGGLVAAIARRMSASIEELRGSLENVNAEPRGQLRIAMVQNLVSDVLDGSIASFTHQYPRVELIIRNVLLPDVQDIVEEGQAEIGVAPVTPNRPDLVYKFLYREQHRPFCGRCHHLFGKTLANCTSLADEVFVLPDVEEADVIRQYRHRHGWGTRHVGRSPYLSEVRRMVVAGLGVGFLPEEMLKTDIAAGKLWPLMAPQTEAQADVLVVSNPSATKSIASNRFLEVLTEFN